MPIIPPPALINQITGCVAGISSKIGDLLPKLDTGASNKNNAENSRIDTVTMSRAKATSPEKLFQFGFKMMVLKQLLEQDSNDPNSLRYKIAEAIEALKIRNPHPKQTNDRLEEALEPHFFPNNQEGEAEKLDIKNFGELLIDKSKLSVVKGKEVRFGEDIFELKMQIEGKLNKEPFKHTVNLVISGFNNEIGQGLNLDISDPQESISRIFRDSAEMNS